MPRGGKRNGAGRKPSATTKKTRAIADKVASEGITPLEVMLFVMRHLYEDEDYRRAADIARDAAPYVHPRLSAVAFKDMTPHEDEPEPVREIVVSTREQAEALLPLLTQAGGIPERP